jgi:gliding motility-associated protein GldC
METTRKANILLEIELDPQNNPVKLSWTADEGGLDPQRTVKALMLHLWDAKENNSMRIELWEKDFMVEEMRAFVYQSMLALADTLQRATQDEDVAEDLREFAGKMGEKLELF